MDQQLAPRRGYLNENFRLFCLADAHMKPVDWHYHNFHKLVFFLAGHASYAIEGRGYALEPGDMVLVPAGCIHRPEVQPGLAYERYILYIDPQYLRRLSTEQTDLELCFRQVNVEDGFALRPGGEGEIQELLEELRAAQDTVGFGQDVLCQALVVRLLVSITRNLEEHRLRHVTSAACDEKIVAVLKYLNLHLCQSISIDDLAKQFFMSKFYMMRRFKAETGYTIHSYLTEKRLLLARQQIGQGKSLSQVCGDCGFGDYSTFSRAYRRHFGVSPGTPLEEKGKGFPTKPEE